jgi:adenylosuccinate synthase
VLRHKLQDNLNEKNEIFSKVYGHAGFNFEDIYRQYLDYGTQLAPFITDTEVLLNKIITDKKDVLFEGAQGTFLDIDFGTYPFVTSSSATAGGACIGTGIAPMHIDQVIGVAKAYTTRVGEGPFPTEFNAELDTLIRDKGREFGATTGRPRRCGWFDAVMVGQAILLNGIEQLAIMKLDILSGLESIEVCTAYKYKGKTFKQFPHDYQALTESAPVYKRLPGWGELSKNPRRLKDLPATARDYLAFLQDLLATRITMVSIGSARADTIFVK